MFFLLMY